MPKTPIPLVLPVHPTQTSKTRTQPSYFFSPPFTYPAATLALSIFATAAGISLFNLPNPPTASPNLPSTPPCLSSGPIPSSALRPLTAPSSATRSLACPSPASSAAIPARVASPHRLAAAKGARRFSCAIDRRRSSSSEISASMRSRLRGSKGSYSCRTCGVLVVVVPLGEVEEAFGGLRRWVGGLGRGRPLIVRLGAARVKVLRMYCDEGRLWC